MFNLVFFFQVKRHLYMNQMIKEQIKLRICKEYYSIYNFSSNSWTFVYGSDDEHWKKNWIL